MHEIAAIIDSYTQNIPGKLGVGFKNLKTNEEYYIRGEERFPAASTFKVPVLIELFHQAACGKIDLDELYTLTEKDISPGSGVLSLLSPGLTMRIRDYAVLMMIVSDNTGTDIIFNRLGKENIWNQINALGLKNTRSDLSCKDLLARIYKGMPEDISGLEMMQFFNRKEYRIDDTLYTNLDTDNDVSSPRDMVTMFSKIYHKEIISPEACEEMMEIMGKCQTNSRIPYLLPPGTMVMHKTGTLDAVVNDCGIIETDANAYILALFYNGYQAQEIKDTRSQELLLANISKEVFDTLHS